MPAIEYTVVPSAIPASVVMELRQETPETQRLLATLHLCAHHPLPFIMAELKWRVVSITLDSSTPHPQIGLIPWQDW